MLNRIMKDENGVLTFEWILLITLLVIGIIGGVAAIRDALIIECAETAGAIVALNQSYAVSGPWTIKVSDSLGVTVEMTETTGEQSVYSDTAGKVTITSAAAGSNASGSTTTDNP